MTRTQPPRSIVVGIDGSDAGLRAARWAVDEAANRGLALRLVHVIEPGSQAVRLETEYAHIALRSARAAAYAVSPRVSIDTVVKRGGIDTVLARESRTAEMLCIGSAATDERDESTGPLLSARLAHTARCPVAVIGVADERAAAQGPCLAVVTTDSSAREAMLRDALDQARRRRLPLLVVDAATAGRLDPDDDAMRIREAQLCRSYPDVVVHRVVVQTDIGAFLAQITPAMALTMVDADALRHGVGAVRPELTGAEHRRCGTAPDDRSRFTTNDIAAELVSTGERADTVSR
ncbi:universal stress protein [Mycobacterium adipatum]|uniref:universal stress protein n=1 Tax=Mycobacterium adipatum TaxID=1682113 RepID=UPI0034E0C3B3